MNVGETKSKLQDILSGKSVTSPSTTIQSVAYYLRSSERTGPLAEKKHQNKHKEIQRLKDFAVSNDLVIDDIDENRFISSGAEQKVYIHNQNSVVKLNDGIYYASWEDYFNNLLLHNYFFPDTAYQLLGFYSNSESFFAVVKQVFVLADKLTLLNAVKEFLNINGFTHTRNHDYYHPELGIILEDLHDENVLTKSNVLYFIDTVFYIVPEVFYKTH